MRVRFQVSGGIAAFPGLDAARRVDLEDLPHGERESLEQLIRDADFFELPGRLEPSRGAADYQLYEISIEDGDRRHTVIVSDPVPTRTLQALIARLRELPRQRPSSR